MSEGEEKTEEASARKLDKAREDGEIATTKDFKEAILLAAMLLYALYGYRIFIDDIRYITDTALNYGNERFEVVLATMLPLAVVITARVVLPFFIIHIALELVLSILLNKGLLFAIKPITPDLNRINPVSGFKNIFAERAWVELAKSVFMLAALGTIFVVVSTGAVRDLAHLPACGFQCIGPALHAAVKPLVLSAIAVLLIAGAADLPLQRYLFLKQQRMTKSDVKRENKESYGSPELQRERKRLQNEAKNTPGKLGVANASLLIYGPDSAIGLRFVEGETPVPLVVARSRTRVMTALLRANAARAGVRELDEPEVSAKLSKILAPGKYIREGDFAPVIDAFRKAGVF